MTLRFHVIIILLFCATGLFAQQPPLQVITTATSTPMPGDSLDVEIRMSDFDELTSFNLYFVWDSTVMVVDTIPFVDQSVLPAFTRAGLVLPAQNARNPQQGQMLANWFLPQPFSIPDSTHLFTLRFLVVGQQCDTTSFRLEDIGTLPAEMVEVLDMNFEPLPVEISSDVVMIDGVGCGTTTQQPVEFDLLNVTTTNGSNICMPMLVSNFDSIATFGGSLSWDPAELSFSNVGAFGVNGFSAADFLLNSTNSGSLSYGWANPAGATPPSLVPDATLFEVCFDVVGAPGTTTTVDIVDNPVPVSVTMANPGGGSTPRDFTTSNGLVIIESTVSAPPVGFNIDNVNAATGDNVCIPVEITDFTNINSFMGSVNWDENLLQYTGAQAFGVTNFGNNNINANNADEGEVGFIWMDISGNNPQDIPNGGTLVEFCFDVLATTGTTAALDFTNDPFDINVTSPNPVPGGINIPLETTISNGSITVPGVSAGEVIFTLPNLSGDNGDNVCVPITVEGFDNITAVT